MQSLAWIIVSALLSMFEPSAAAPPADARVSSELTLHAAALVASGAPAPDLYAEAITLDGWFHPLTGAVRDLPVKRDRRFGGPRPGPRADECGRGHCGVDIGSKMGTPIVAARDGVVDRADRGKTGSTGRYVRILHDDGTRTYYMHLGRVAAGVDVGARVKGGAVIGTLGRTGIKRSPPHLHFAMTVQSRWGSPYHVDPEPMLRTARLVSRDEVARVR